MGHKVDGVKGLYTSGLGERGKEDLEIAGRYIAQEDLVNVNNQ